MYCRVGRVAFQKKFHNVLQSLAILSDLTHMASSVSDIKHVLYCIETSSCAVIASVWKKL